MFRLFEVKGEHSVMYCMRSIVFTVGCLIFDANTGTSMLRHVLRSVGPQHRNSHLSSPRIIVKLFRYIALNTDKSLKLFFP